MLQNYDFYSKAKSQNGKNVGQNGKKAHFPHFDRSNQFKPKLKPKLKPSSNRSNPIQTQFKPNSNPIRTHLEPKLEIHVSSHAARDSEGGSNSRGYRHDELNYQLPSVLFRFCTHNAIFLLNINFLEVRGEISHKRTCPDCSTLRT